MKIVDVKFTKFDIGRRPVAWHDATFTESSLSFPLTQVILTDKLIDFQCVRDWNFCVPE